MSKSNVVALFASIPSSLSSLAIELVKLRAAQDAKADLSSLTFEVFTLFSGEAVVSEDNAKTEPDEKPLTAAQKKKKAAEDAAAKKQAAAEAAAAAAEGDKKPAPKKDKKPAVDVAPFKAQVADFLEWLGADKEDEITGVLQEFGAEAEDDITDEQYPEFYKLIRELADAEFDLSEIPDLLAA